MSHKPQTPEAPQPSAPLQEEGVLGAYDVRLNLARVSARDYQVEGFGGFVLLFVFNLKGFVFRTVFLLIDMV